MACRRALSANLGRIAHELASAGSDQESAARNAERTTMRADCDREGLLSACQLVSAAVSSRDVKPILRNFKVIAEGDRCTLMATDLELGIRFDVQNLIIQEPGEAILPAARLIAILREARDTRLSIEADSTACMVRGASLEFEMPSEDPAQFPDIPTFADEKYHEISSG